MLNSNPRLPKKNKVDFQWWTGDINVKRVAYTFHWSKNTYKSQDFQN